MCEKFQKNAKECYPDEYTHFDLSSGYHLPDLLPMHRIKNFLSIFGPLIESIDWMENENNSHDKEIFNAIVEFCGKNLLSLDITGHRLTLPKGSQFQMLEELTLKNCAIHNFRQR